MQNVAKYHEIVLSRFARRDFLDGAANESDIVERPVIQAADPGSDVDGGDLGVGIGGVQSLRYSTFPATHFENPIGVRFPLAR